MSDTSAKKQILMVDDDKTQSSFAEVVLNSEYDVITVTSGKEAVERLSKDLVPDLVLLDVLMPEMDGFATFDKIRTMDTMQNVPVIFLTAVNAPEEIKKALSAGAADYITKPYAMENFTNRIKNAIQMYEYKKREGK